MQRHTCLCRTLQTHGNQLIKPITEDSTHNIDVVSRARNCEVLAVMRETQVRDRLSGIKCQLALRGELNKGKTHSHTVIVRAAIHSLVSNRFTIESNPPEAR